MKIFELLEGGLKVAIVAFFLLKEDTNALFPLFIFPCVIFIWVRMRTAVRPELREVLWCTYIWTLQSTVIPSEIECSSLWPKRGEDPGVP